jgi:1,4-alpha-glucan branching enzyme
MKRLLTLCLVLLASLACPAQLLTWTPPFPTENDPSQTLVITMDASKGNRGLFNHTPVTDVYVHIGVITNLSTSSASWRYVRNFGTPDNQVFSTAIPQLQATSLGNNKWSFTITGSLRSYFGITDPNESIQKIALLFRSGNGSKKQANSDGSDMYIPVYNNANLTVRVDQPASEPRYIPVPEVQTWTVGSTFTITGNANRVSNMKLYHNGNVIASQNGVQTLTATGTVAAFGSQQIVAEAIEGSTVRRDTITIFVAPSASPTAALPSGLRDGINYEADASAATLVLHAPGKNIVTVIGDFNNWTETTQHIMNRTPDGKKFWIRLTGLTPGTEYGFQYVVDNSLRIGDPYTEKVLDPWNDQYITSATYPNLKPYPAGKTTGIVSVLQTSAPTYSWTVPNFPKPDKRGLIIYEMLLRDFIAAHDWKTLSDTLNYLKNLGVNAIELMPFNEFEGNISWGYNPDYYFAPDKYYGPKNSLKQFIDSCHKNGIAVIMDIALNHSFGLSPMVQLYWDPLNNRPAANNPWFNPTARHPVNVGFDMNHESLDTRYFSSRVMEHWLQEYKIDGFRFDLSKGFTQVNSCVTPSCNGNADFDAWGARDQSRIDIWKRYYDTVQTKSSGAYVILEHFAANNEEKELSEYGMMFWGNLNYAYTEAAKANSSGWDLTWGVHLSRTWTNPHLVTYMESHDEERIIYNTLLSGNSNSSYNTRVLDTALRRMELDAAFFFTIPGPKMIWQFGEVGYDFGINRCEDGSINNDCRLSPKPIRWDYLTQVKRKHVYDTYSKLIKLRFHPWYKAAFVSNRVDYSLTGAFKWIRINTDTSNVMVVGNFGLTQATSTVTFPSSGTWYEYLDNSTFTATGSAQSISLQPGEFHVYVNRNLNNSSTTPVTSVPWTGTALEAGVYPNPIGSEFIVEVKLPRSGDVKVDLFNMQGQHVQTLHSGFLMRGSHQMDFRRGAMPAASGNYFIRIQAGTAIKTIQVTF